MIHKHINFPVFIISFLLGIIFTFLSSPENKTVYVYPTPDNADKIDYIDKADICYTFTPEQVTCPKDKKDIKVIPVQTSKPESPKKLF